VWDATNIFDGTNYPAITPESGGRISYLDGTGTFTTLAVDAVLNLQTTGGFRYEFVYRNGAVGWIMHVTGN
jgi:hypothetical protein